MAQPVSLSAPSTPPAPPTAPRAPTLDPRAWTRLVVTSRPHAAEVARWEDDGGAVPRPPTTPPERRVATL
jgi:hypothetical protein